jgi:hypothetical protein
LIGTASCGITDGIDMAQTEQQNTSEVINLVYIRAAILANTGVRLTLKEVRRYLIEEGFISRSDAIRKAPIFRDYREYFRTEEFSRLEMEAEERE